MAQNNVNGGIGSDISAPGRTRAKRAKWRAQLEKNRRARADLNREFCGELGSKRSAAEYHSRLSGISRGTI